MERTLAEAGVLDRVAALLTAADAGLAENRSPGPIAVEVLRRLHAGGGRRLLGARAREASRFVEDAARARGLDREGFRGVSPALHAQAAARWGAGNDALAMQVWAIPWRDRVADDAPPPVNEVTARPPDPGTASAVADILHGACTRFGLTLRDGWPSRLSALADASATLAASALHRARAMLRT